MQIKSLGLPLTRIFTKPYPSFSGNSSTTVMEAPQRHCSVAACQEIVWLYQRGREGFPWNEGSLHDGRIGGEAMLPSREGRKAVRGQSGSTGQSHALVPGQQNSAPLARQAGSYFVANDDNVDLQYCSELVLSRGVSPINFAWISVEHPRGLLMLLSC